MTYSATDRAGIIATGSFPITVRNTVLPDLLLPAGIVEEADCDDGGLVSIFSVSALDLIGGPLVVSCDRESGSLFAIGVIVFTCWATNGSGDPIEGAFTVTVSDTTPHRRDPARRLREPHVRPGGRWSSDVLVRKLQRPVRQRNDGQQSHPGTGVGTDRRQSHQRRAVPWLCADGQRPAARRSTTSRSAGQRAASSSVVGSSASAPRASSRSAPSG